MRVVGSAAVYAPRMTTKLVIALALALAFASACGPPQVSSADSARIAYLGVDKVVSKSLALGLQGFNAATNANIADQTANGDVSGKIVVGGQVDQGASSNRTMTLTTTLTDYSDGKLDDPKTSDKEQISITYATKSGAPLSLAMQLKNVPSGTLDGSLNGTVTMDGDLTGDLTLDVTMSGTIEEDPAHAGQTIRTPGATHVTGTAKSAAGTFDIDETI